MAKMNKYQMVLAAKAAARQAAVALPSGECHVKVVGHFNHNSDNEVISTVTGETAMAYAIRNARKEA